jgi:hypothetical protein
MLMTENTTHRATKTTSKRNDPNDNPFDFPSSDAITLDCILLKKNSKTKKYIEKPKQKKMKISMVTTLSIKGYERSNLECK